MAGGGGGLSVAVKGQSEVCHKPPSGGELKNLTFKFIYFYSVHNFTVTNLSDYVENSAFIVWLPVSQSVTFRPLPQHALMYTYISKSRILY